LNYKTLLTKFFQSNLTIIAALCWKI